MDTARQLLWLIVLKYQFDQVAIRTSIKQYNALLDAVNYKSEASHWKPGDAYRRRDCQFPTPPRCRWTLEPICDNLNKSPLFDCCVYPSSSLTPLCTDGKYISHIKVWKKRYGTTSEWYCKFWDFRLQKALQLGKFSNKSMSTYQRCKIAYSSSILSQV